MMQAVFSSRSGQQRWLHGAICFAAAGALALLLTFYSVVTGAVEKAASRHGEAAERSSALADVVPSLGRHVRVARLEN